MHPLPRRDEISDDFDSDPRSIYFKQAARGERFKLIRHDCREELLFDLVADPGEERDLLSGAAGPGEGIGRADEIEVTRAELASELDRYEVCKREVKPETFRKGRVRRGR